MSHRDRRDDYRSSDPRPPLPTRSMMGSRIYIGKLPQDCREKDLDRTFGKFGRVVEVAMKGNYCFLQYERSSDAVEAVNKMHGRTFLGERISVEHARQPREFGYRAPTRSHGSSSHSDNYSRSRRSPPPTSDYRLDVTNLSTRCDGRDLREIMEKAGEVVHAEAHKKRVGEGTVEFTCRKYLERAFKKLDRLEINGKPIKLEIIEKRKSRRSRSSSSSSRSDSRSESRSPKRKRRRRSSSESDSDDESGSEKDSPEKNSDADDKNASDDDEFDEAERCVKRRREQLISNGDKLSNDDDANDTNRGDVEKEVAESQTVGNAETEVLEDVVKEASKIEEEIPKSHVNALGNDPVDGQPTVPGNGEANGETE